MRSHCALYVDAGYLIAAAATRVSGTSLRGSVVVSYPDLISRLIAQVEASSGMPLLRVNWYDSGNKGIGGADPEQESIGMQPRVKLRLGRRSPHGEQKGVDLRIGLDLASHGRNRVVDTIYLVSGDDDLTEAVEEAQNHGVQVVILAAPGPDGRQHAVAKHLIRESDGIELIDVATIDDTVHVRTLQADQDQPLSEAAAAVKVPLPGPRHSNGEPDGDGPAADAATSTDTRTDSAPSMSSAVPTPAILAHTKSIPVVPMPAGGFPTMAPRGSEKVYSTRTGIGGEYAHGVSRADEQLVDQVCRSVLQGWVATATESDRRRLIAEKPYIPNDIDRTLLNDLSNRLGQYEIEEALRFALRERFWDAVEAQLT